MKRSDYAVTGSLVLAILVIGTDVRAGGTTQYDAQDDNLPPAFPPLMPREFIGSLDTIDIEIVALSLVSASPIMLTDFTTGDNGGGPGLPGDFGFGSFDFLGFDPFPFTNIDFDIAFTVTDPGPVPIELVQLSLVSDGPSGFDILYEFFETIFGALHLTTFDFTVPDNQPLIITDATVTPTGIGTFDLHVEMQTLDFLNSDLPLLNFTLTGVMVPAPAGLVVLGLAATFPVRRRRRGLELAT